MFRSLPRSTLRRLCYFRYFLTYSVLDYKMILQGFRRGWLLFSSDYFEVSSVIRCKIKKHLSGQTNVTWCLTLILNIRVIISKLITWKLWRPRIRSKCERHSRDIMHPCLWLQFTCPIFSSQLLPWYLRSTFRRTGCEAPGRY